MLKRKLISTLMQIRPERANGFRILTYHSVRPPEAGGSSPYVVDPERFARQVECLSVLRCNVVSLSVALEAVRSGAPLPPRTVVLSFDDGYRDNLTYAALILRTFRYPAVVFLCPDLFGRPAGRYGEFVAQSPLLTSDEVVELMGMGWEIGGHTNAHLRLTACGSAEEVHREISGCRAALQRCLGQDVRTFAYPYGQFNHLVKAVTRRNGFWGACSTVHGFNDASSDPFELRRTYVYGGESLGDFKRKLLGGYDWMGYFDRRSLARQA